MAKVELRWVQERNKMPTAREVHTFAFENGLSFMDAKAKLLNHSPLRLQYRVGFGEWIDVPTVIVERDKWVID